MTLEKEFSWGHVGLTAFLIGGLTVAVMFVLAGLDTHVALIGLVIPHTVAGFAVARSSAAPRYLEAALGVLVVAALVVVLEVLGAQRQYLPGIEVEIESIVRVVVGTAIGVVLVIVGALLGRRRPVRAT